MQTILTADFEQGGKMTGEEWYPMIGGMFDIVEGNFLVKEIIKKFKGLPLMGGCIEKNRIVNKYAYYTIQVVGAVEIISADGMSTYGHEFNPPFEQHSWLVDEEHRIIDFALPGLILRGMKEKDDIGPFLVGRDPVILAGLCPDWIKYRPKRKVKFI